MIRTSLDDALQSCPSYSVCVSGFRPPHTNAPQTCMRLFMDRAQPNELAIWGLSYGSDSNTGPFLTRNCGNSKSGQLPCPRMGSDRKECLTEPCPKSHMRVPRACINGALDDHIDIRILQTMIAGIPLILGLETRMYWLKSS